MKFWLIAFFLTPDGEFVSKREVAYKDEATCYIAMYSVRSVRSGFHFWRITLKAKLI